MGYLVYLPLRWKIAAKACSFWLFAML